MKDLLIISYKTNKEGVSLELNKKVSLNAGVSSKTVWVSWDRIGKALFPDKYSEETDVAKLNEKRAQNTL